MTTTNHAVNKTPRLPFVYILPVSSDVEITFIIIVMLIDLPYIYSHRNCAFFQIAITFCSPRSITNSTLLSGSGAR